MKTIFIVIIIFIMGCENKLDSLMGNWHVYRVTTINNTDGSEFSIDGRPLNPDPDLSLNFIDTKTVIVTEMGQEYTLGFRVKDSIIKISHREYAILKINKQELVLKENEEILYLKKY